MRTLLLFAVLTAQVHAQVYRTIDKEGNVTYSDQATEGAVEVEVKELETIKALDTDQIAPLRPASPDEQELYTGLRITSPQNDEAIRDNTGNLVISVAVTPRLLPAHKLILYLDGAEYAAGEATSFQLQNIDRGTHQVRAAVVDENGQETINSDTINFHMLRFSTLTSPSPKPPAK
jgi:hypothetical protein